MRSFADPSTHFRIEKSHTPPSVDGFKIGEPTGHVICLSCLESHTNIDDIPHTRQCPQRFVHSRWYAETMASD